MVVRKHIDVSGIVQGVGFRPYVFRLASSHNLRGHVGNNSCGVTIEVQGSPEAVQDFVQRLPVEAPRLARISNFVMREVPCSGETGFRIIHSQRGENVHTLISPDVSICPDCLRELFDPKDRRHGYPFINCTNCGPRFTIVKDIPYDRPYTSMAVFPMCPACQAEYQDPLNRRFHAQPNACWDCGPQVDLWDSRGQKIDAADPIAEAVRQLLLGKIVAVKGLGGFHLAVDATNSAAVSLLRRRKRRVEKPFAVMVPDLDTARQICDVDTAACDVLQSAQRPIVLLPRARQWRIAEEVAPANRYLGLFLPYTPIHYLLFRSGELKSLVMTSGNLSEEPIAIDNAEAASRLRGLADLFLVHNREILLRCDDSVVRVVNGETRQIRRSRGFVPAPVFLKHKQPPVLAVGGELKNTICLTSGDHAFLSQHIGDLENAEGCAFFEEAIAHLRKILGIQPEIVAHDLHPDYFSANWALQSGIPTIGVQHHHAHIASCMAENHLDRTVIGLALDGTGYGSDGKIWGGEVLIADYVQFERAAHFEYVSLPTCEGAIREPWRMAVSYLAHYFEDELWKVDVPFVRGLDRKKTEVLCQMIRKGINSPLTSSCGRLFDAVAALAGIRPHINYEAQAAIELEMAIETGLADKSEEYPFELVPDGEHWIIGARPLFLALIEDLKNNASLGTISRRFHDGLIVCLAEIAARVRERTGLRRICLSGGTFHNVYLSQGLERRLMEDGFEVFTQREVPAGDGGLSLGQAMIAAHQAAI
ncbi:MAG TPA: carbamoyltransferase HypF [Candidatus Binatia bacterium]|nr:carbamoyltransferase HypF [Candidatus Binatia bacterium]